MLNKYAHSAFTYAADWLWYDRPAIAVLSCESPEPSDQKACDTLSHFAAEYKVSRTLKIIEETPRLINAWRAIQKIERPNAVDDAKNRVKELVDSLSGPYGNQPWSAASKFLWIRFRSPIVLYDSLSRKWMTASGRHKCQTWGDFHDAWRQEFLGRQDEIRDACEGLLKVRDYLPPTPSYDGQFDAISDAELEQAARSEWFSERVFDHFMLNEVSYPRSGNEGAK